MPETIFMKLSLHIMTPEPVTPTSNVKITVSQFAEEEEET
jgi:hypothetical protein